MQEGIECPKCGKHTVVQRSETVFQCISCDFKRDLARESQQKKTDGGDDGSWLGVWLTLALIIITFSMGTSSTFVDSEPGRTLENSIFPQVVP